MKQHKRANEPWGVTPELRTKLYAIYVIALTAIVAMVYSCLRSLPCPPLALALSIATRALVISPSSTHSQCASHTAPHTLASSQKQAGVQRLSGPRVL